MTQKLANVHPGEVLREDFLIPLGLSAYQLAKATGLSQKQVGAVLRGEQSVTAATDLRLEAYFGGEAQFWTNLQNRLTLRKRGRSWAMSCEQFRDTLVTKI